MSCEHYKKSLTAAAAAQQSGSLVSAALPAELLQHLENCADCRAAFAEEQSLFAAIDANLHASANAEIPSSLLPRVRAQIETTAPPASGWFPLSAALAATAILAIFLAGKAVRDKSQDPGVPVAVNFVSRPGAPAPQISPLPTQSNPSPRDNHRSPSRTQLIHRAAAFHSDVSTTAVAFVPPNQRKAIDQLVQGLRSGKIDAQTLLAAQQPIDDLQIKPVEVPAVEVKPLESSADTDSPQ